MKNKNVTANVFSLLDVVTSWGKKIAEICLGTDLFFFWVAFKEAFFFFFFHEGWKIYGMKTLNFDRIMKAHHHWDC